MPPIPEESSMRIVDPCDVVQYFPGSMSASTLNLKFDRACAPLLSCHNLWTGFDRANNEVRFPFWLALLPGIISAAVPLMNWGGGLIGCSAWSDLAATKVSPTIDLSGTHTPSLPHAAQTGLCTDSDSPPPSILSAT